MPPRRLHFAVGTSLLTASLGLGCGSFVTTNPVPNEEEDSGGTETGTETGTATETETGTATETETGTATETETGTATETDAG